MMRPVISRAPLRLPFRAARRLRVSIASPRASNRLHMASSDRAPASSLSPPPVAGSLAVHPPPESCVVTVVVPLEKGHDHNTNSPNIHRFEVKLAVRNALEPPTPLEKAVSVCVRSDMPVIHLQHKSKPYENKYFEIIASQLKSAMEQLERTSSDDDDDDDAKSDQGDFSDDDDAPDVKRRKLDPRNRSEAPVPKIKEILVDHLTRSIARKDDDSYRRVKPLVLTPTQSSLVVFWELCDEELSAE
jgi:hypothetical protein